MELDQQGMVIDFNLLKLLAKEVIAELDHRYLNDHPYFKERAPTAENISYFLFTEIYRRLKPPVALKGVKVWEKDDSFAEYKDTI